MADRLAPDSSSVKYMVCIHCMTYNHEKYLADALEGFVMQKTDFPFVAVVIDDCSTDGTADVLRRYEEKYPEIIKAVYLQENYYSQHKSKQPFLEPWDSKSKYIALCEGDDYWTDPLKLQKQVDFLETHIDYSMCFHAARIQKEIPDVSTENIKFAKIESREYHSTELFISWIVPTASILFRKDAIINYKVKYSDWLTRGDICIVEKCTHSGRVFGFSQIMSTYRVQTSGVTYDSHSRYQETFRLPKHFKCIYINFPQIDKSAVRWTISQSYYSRMKLQKHYYKKVTDMILCIYWCPSFVAMKIKKQVIK